MKITTLLTILILAVGSIFAVVYASNTTITNTSVSTTTVNTSDLVAGHDVNTTNLFVTGSCTGCGGGGSGEGSYTNYNTILLNQSYPSLNVVYLPPILISNNGTITANDQPTNFVISSTCFVDQLQTLLTS